MKNLLGLLIFLMIVGNSLAQIPVSQTGKFFNYNGTKVYYEDIGQGEPLLLLHNFNSTADSWKPYYESYSKSFRVISVDMVGHGRSDIYDGGSVEFKHQDYARIILACENYSRTA